MELRHLRLFLTILEQGSVNRAASVLGLTQPSVSYSLKALERSVGAELFTRSGSGITTTRIGEEFAHNARFIVREAEKAQGQVDRIAGHDSGHIVFGVLSIFSADLLPAVLTEFVSDRSNPLVDTRVFIAPPEKMVMHLVRSEWDLVLTMAPKAYAFPAEIAVNHIGSAPSSVYCGADHPFARQQMVSLSDLEASDWAISNINLSRLMLTQAFRTPPKIRICTDSMHVILDLVMNSNFLCLAPEALVSQQVSKGHLVRVAQTTLESSSDVIVAFSGAAEKTTGLTAMIDIVRRRFADISG